MKARMKLATFAIAMLASVALGVAPAFGATAELTGPSTGDCLWATKPVTGTASGGTGLRWELRVVRTDTGAAIHEATGTNSLTNGTITSFDTTVAPVGVALRAELVVVDDGDLASTARTFTPEYDRLPPYRPDAGSLAVAGTQGWVWWSQTADRGDCRSGQATGSSYVVAIDVTNGEGTSTLAPDVHAIRNDTDHEALTQNWLRPGFEYDLVAIAVDRAGNWTTGNPTRIRTPNNIETVVAGQARKAAQPGYYGVVSGLVVRANGQSGNAQTITDARGMYRLSVPVFSNGVPYSVIYGPGCDDANGDPLLPPAYCATGWATPAITDSVSLGLEGPARVFIKSKTL